jgi:hypothetical protein
MRPLLALLTALCLLFGLPATGATAKHKSKTKHAKRHACAKRSKHKARMAKSCRKHKKHKPHHGQQGSQLPGGSGTDDTDADDSVPRIGTIASIDGDLLTIALDEGGSLSATVTDDTDVICAASADDPEDDPADDDSTDPADDDPADDDPADDDPADDDPADDDPAEDDDPAARSARLAGPCVPATGDPVYDYELDDSTDVPTFIGLDLVGE